MSIGERVRTGRKALHLSQEEVARRAGVSLNQVNRLERGEIVDPHFSTLAGLATALDMQISELVGEPVHHVRKQQDSIEVSDKVKADIRLQKVRQILDARDAGRLDDVDADKEIQREYQQEDPAA